MPAMPESVAMPARRAFIASNKGPLVSVRR